MNDFFSVNTLLFAAKWVFVGLIYLALLIVVVAVRREMSLRVGSGKPLASAAPGKLRVIESGTDPNIVPGSVFPLGLNTKLGAAEDNDILLLDQFISSHHTRLRWDGAAWWVEDQGSKNGTFVNDIPCTPMMPQRIQHGGQVRIGGMVFELME